MKPSCSVFFHNYYGNHEYWMDFFLKNLSVPSNLFYNMVENSIYNIEASEPYSSFKYQASATDKLRKIVYRKSSNKGKDIGGKLVLLDAYQKLDIETEYGLFLHDKKSPHKVNNTTWTAGLLKVAMSNFGRNAMELFSAKPGVGIITASGNVKNEYSDSAKSFISTNKLLLPELQKQFTIFPGAFQYVPGTMFWFRMQPIKQFFKRYSPLTIREMLENGNVTDESAGSYTHCWERLLCWIITAQNYKIETM